MTRGIRMLSALPSFVVADVEASLAYYRDRLGFRVCGLFGDKPEQFGIVDRAEGQAINFKSTASCAPAGAARAGGTAVGRRNRTAGATEIDAYVRVGDADRLHADFARRGARLLAPPTDKPWQSREFLVEDPDGFVLCFGADLTGEWPPDGFTISPQLVVADIARTAAFWRDRLGFTGVRTFFDPPAYAIISRGGVRLHFSRAATPAAVPRSNRAAAEVWDACIEIVGVDAYAAELAARGVALVRGPEDTFYGSREIEVADPDGYHICFAEPEE